MLIDTTFFVAELEIPNPDSAGVAERINWFINQYEPEFLQKAFNYPFYKVFADAVYVSDPNTIPQKYKDILNGVEYTASNGLLSKWRGLVIKATPIKKSPIANYVYNEYMRSIASQSTGIGEVNTQPTPGSIITSPGQKMARAWNEMSTWVAELYDYMTVSGDTYPEFNFSDVRYNYFGYKYMRTPFGSMNILNL